MGVGQRTFSGEASWPQRAVEWGWAEGRVGSPVCLQWGMFRSWLRMGVGSVWGPSRSRAGMEQWAWDKESLRGKATGEVAFFPSI